MWLYLNSKAGFGQDLAVDMLCNGLGGRADGQVVNKSW